MNKRLVLKLVGSVLMIEGALMLVPAVISLLMGGGDLSALLISAGVTLFVGSLFSRLKTRNDNLRAREGFATVALCWILVSLFGALPFRIHGSIPNFVDAFFESASGFTTTGATILTNVEAMPKGLLFWRSFTHWVGGMGVLVLSLALIPKMGGRSMHLMRAESPGPSVEKLVPRVGNNAKILYRLYIILSVLLLIALLCAGMNLYDALIHTFGTAGTGGFSNYNASIGHFNSPAIELIIATFMLLFGVNFSLYYFLMQKHWRACLGNSELRAYLTIIAGTTLIITLCILPQYGNDLLTSLRHGFFQVSSIITSTGFATADFNLWPQLARTLIVGLMLVGACAGSTGGGIKVIRFQILWRIMVREIRRTVHPKSVNNVKMDGRSIEESVVSGVLSFFCAYFLLLICAVIVLSIDGFSLETNVTAVITTLSNIGPGLDTVGPTGNFAGYSNLSTFVLTLCMIIGRLEIFPMLMLFAPSAWRKY